MPPSHSPTLIFTHPDCLGHDTGAGHVESPARLRAALRGLQHPDFSALEYREAPCADIAYLAAVHTTAHITKTFALIPTQGLWNLDPDTVVSPGSRAAALRAAGAVCAAVDAVMTGQAGNAFCAVRPPGHHADADHAAGFCLFNNIAIGAARARSRHRVERVAIVDFDLHHGNGTQSLFWNNRGVFFASLHQWPFDPGTGAAAENGAHDNVLNMPLSAGDGSKEFRAAVSTTLLPRLRRFAPQLLLVSAGFDAHRADPLGSLNLDDADFYWIGHELLKTARQYCNGRLVAVLEGGYDLPALGASAALFVRALLEASSRDPEL
jgi:acetoin utilization deacetylase AcuC-like enzyme